jgi:hypothetical protein
MPSDDALAWWAGAAEKGISVFRFNRPLGVTIVAILVWLQGLLYVAGGLYVILRFGDADFVERLGGQAVATTEAIASLAFALVLFGVTGGILRGNPRTRLLLAILFVISFGSAVYVTAAWLQPIFGPITAALAITGFVFLWTPRAQVFFRPDQAPAAG